MTSLSGYNARSSNRESSPGFREFGQSWLSSIYTRAKAAKSFCYSFAAVTGFDLLSLAAESGEGGRRKLISPCARTKPCRRGDKETQRRIKIYVAVEKFNRQWRRALKTSRRHGRANMAPAPTFIRISVGSLSDLRQSVMHEFGEKKKNRKQCVPDVYIGNGVYTPASMYVCTW